VVRDRVRQNVKLPAPITTIFGPFIIFSRTMLMGNDWLYWMALSA
jgi:hypothetical protein